MYPETKNMRCFFKKSCCLKRIRTRFVTVEFSIRMVMAQLQKIYTILQRKKLEPLYTFYLWEQQKAPKLPNSKPASFRHGANQSRIFRYFFKTEREKYNRQWHSLTFLPMLDRLKEQIRSQDSTKSQRVIPISGVRNWNDLVFPQVVLETNMISILFIPKLCINIYDFTVWNGYVNL